jgi:ATPase family associated with various cellular activities (AAA)
MEFVSLLTYGSSAMTAMAGAYGLHRLTGWTPKSAWYGITHYNDPVPYSLAQYITDYTDAVDQLPGAHGSRRRPLVEQVVGRIRSREAALIILHGAPGVGKTALLEEITKTLAKESVDGREIRVLRLDIYKMAQSVGLRSLIDLVSHGGLEEKLKSLLSSLIEVNQRSGEHGGPFFVLYMDEVHITLQADVFKHFIEQTGGRSDLVVIGATTTRRFKQCDPRLAEESLGRRMLVEEIRSLTTDETIEALFDRFCKSRQMTQLKANWRDSLLELMRSRRPLLEEPAKMLAIEFCYERCKALGEAKALLDEVLNKLALGKRNEESMAAAIASVRGVETKWVLDGRFRVAPTREALRASVLFSSIDFPFQADPSRSVVRLSELVQWKRREIALNPNMSGEITLDDVIRHRHIVLEKPENESRAELEAEDALLQERHELLNNCLTQIPNSQIVIPSLKASLMEGIHHFSLKGASPLILHGQAPFVADGVACSIAHEVGKGENAILHRYQLSLRNIYHLFSKADEERRLGSRTARLQRRLNYFLEDLSLFLKEVRKKPGQTLLVISSGDAKRFVDHLYPPKPLQEHGSGGLKSVFAPEMHSKLDQVTELLDQTVTKVAGNLGFNFRSPLTQVSQVVERSASPGQTIDSTVFGHPAMVELLRVIRQGDCALLVAMASDEFEEDKQRFGQVSILTLPTLGLNESLQILKADCDVRNVKWGPGLSAEVIFQVAVRLDPWCRESPAQGACGLLLFALKASQRAGREQIEVTDLWNVTQQLSSTSIFRSLFDQVVSGAYLWETRLISNIEKRPEQTNEIADGILEKTLVSLYHVEHPAIFIVEPSQLRRHLIRDEVVARVPKNHSIWELNLKNVDQFLAGGSIELARGLLRSYIREQLSEWSQGGHGDHSVLVIEHHSVLNDPDIQKAIADIAKGGRVSLIYLCTSEQFDIPSRDHLGRADIPKKEPGPIDLIHQLRQVLENPLSLIAGPGNDLIGGVKRWFSADEEKKAEPETPSEVKAQPEAKAKTALQLDEVRYLELPAIARWEIVRLTDESKVEGDLPFSNDEAKNLFIALAHHHLKETGLSLESAKRNYQELQARLKLDKKKQVESEAVMEFFLPLFPNRERDDLREMAGLETGRLSQWRRKAKKTSHTASDVAGHYISWRMVRNMSIGVAAITFPRMIYNSINRAVNKVFSLVGMEQ